MSLTFTSVTKYDFDKICRTCLEFKQGMISICTSESDVLQMLQIFTTIKINENNELPTQICNDCIFKTYQTINFKKQCERSEQYLLELLNEQTNDDKKWFKNTTTDKDNTIENISIKSEKENELDIKDEPHQFKDNDDDVISDNDNNSMISSDDDNNDNDELKVLTDDSINVQYNNDNNRLSLRKARINWLQSLSTDQCDLRFYENGNYQRHMQRHQRDAK
ncbi:GATA zinc finger domain-containing protein 13-like [Chrysoperla carnea]|uniref:GATA zinc finger domain-containing protein 13-like n=1 Tax=Chrysoperla carnea TaxID=189513 RepID=UPI001D07188F|nr:GATA zinc finger domain-containing protein 13-like [Chrysoperla carnea]